MEWWKKSVVYQIYVKSFQDSNNDGISLLMMIMVMTFQIIIKFSQNLERWKILKNY